MKKKTRLSSARNNLTIPFYTALVVCVLGAFFSSRQFYYNFFRSLTKLNEEPIATITFKYKTAQRKFLARVVWDRLRQNSPVYNGDTIHTSELSEATIWFKDGNVMDALDVGVYHFVATDASGLKSEDTKDNLVTVKFRKWLDIDVCAGYVIPVALYDDIFKTYLNTSVFPLSGAARVTVMPFKHRYGYLGAALSASYTRIYSPFDSYYIDGNMMIAHADFVYQLPVIKSRLTVEAHAGVGVTALSNLSFHFQHDINSDPLSSVNLSINAGGAAQLYVVKRLYVDVCVDYVQAFMTNMALGMIVPSASIGWQF